MGIQIKMSRSGRECNKTFMPRISQRSWIENMSREYLCCHCNTRTDLWKKIEKQRSAIVKGKLKEKERKKKRILLHDLSSFIAFQNFRTERRRNSWKENKREERLLGFFHFRIVFICESSKSVAGLQRLKPIKKEPYYKAQKLVLSENI